MLDAGRREEPVAEVSLRRRAGADRGSVGRHQVELRAVRMGCVDDRGAIRQAPRAGEQLDRAAPMLGQAFLDLPRLLVGVNVEDEALAIGIARDLLEPCARTGTDGVGSETDHDALRAQ